MIFIEQNVVIYQSIHSKDLAGSQVQKCSRLLNKFEVWVSCETFCDVFVSIFVWVFKMEFNHFFTSKFTIFKIVCFMVANTLKRKNMQIPDFWQNGAVWQYLFEDVVIVSFSAVCTQQTGLTPSASSNSLLIFFWTCLLE